MEAIKLCRLDTPIIFIEARINLSRFVVTGCAAKTSATVTFPSLNLISLFAFCFNIWLNGVASYFFSSSRRHTRLVSDWSSDVCSSDLHAMSIAESASVKTPPGPELPAARRSLAAMASTWVGSSPTTRRASASTAARSAGVSAPPKKVRPRPTRPWSVPSSRVTNSRVSVGAGRPTTSGLSAGVRSTRVVTWVIFMAGSRLRQEVADDDARARRGQRRDGRLGAKDLARRVAPAERRRRISNSPPVNLQHTIDEVQDPIVVQTGTGVEAALVLAVELEARLCHFDDEHGPRGMLAAVVSPASASDRDIRLGLRHIVQRDRPLRPYE